MTSANPNFHIEDLEIEVDGWEEQAEDQIKTQKFHSDEERRLAVLTVAAKSNKPRLKEMLQLIERESASLDAEKNDQLVPENQDAVAREIDRLEELTNRLLALSEHG